MSYCRVEHVIPELTSELRQLLAEQGEVSLADQVSGLVIFDRCRCGDEFCATFDTVPSGVANGPRRTIALKPERGMLNLDIVDGRIVCVEVLYRDEIRDKIKAALP